MQLVFILAVLATCQADVDIITSPVPGNEYVRLTGSTGNHRNSSELRVQIKDDGQTGVQHKTPYPIKKAEGGSLKKDTGGLKAFVKDEGASGIISKKQVGNGVPPQKHLPYEVISGRGDDKGGLDFDDDAAPLGKKKLTPAGTAQASRVNVKKGPNGQDYEYEYVYYYYDDEDPEDVQTSSPVTSPPRGKPIEHEKDSRKQESRDRHEISEDDLNRRRTETRLDDKSKNRYTTIERGRSRESEATTPEPVTNEIYTSRGGQAQRTSGRGRGQPTPENVEEERLPSGTRFPSRGRNGGSHQQLHQQTTQPPQTEPPNRTKTGTANIRRPSLVDSSSFRTHSSDVAPEADQGSYYSRGSPIPYNTRESDLEEYIVETVKPTTYVPQTTTIKYHPLPPLPEEPIRYMPDKAALDLYAILQQTQEENYVSPIDNFESATTEVVQTTTTTTTTTEAPTTTTTTTVAPGRGRFRSPGGVRTRPRLSYSSTTTSAPTEVTESKKSKFSPSHLRSSGQSSYGRRGSQKSTTPAPQEEPKSTSRPKSNSASRYRSRGRQPVNQEESVKTLETTTAAVTPSRPTRARLNLSAARPLRPGPRINLRSKPGQTTVSTSVSPVSQEEPITSPIYQEEVLVETTPSTPPAPQDALSRLRNRPRLRVSPRPHAPPSEATTVAVQPASLEPEASNQNEQQHEEVPQPAERPKSPSHLLRRRPAIRKLTLPHSQPPQR